MKFISFNENDEVFLQTVNTIEEETNEINTEI